MPDTMLSTGGTKKAKSFCSLGTHSLTDSCYLCPIQEKGKKEERAVVNVERETINILS